MERHGANLDVDVFSVDLNQTILKFNIFLKHDISELTACSVVVKPALLKVKTKLFIVELDI